MWLKKSLNKKIIKVMFFETNGQSKQEEIFYIIKILHDFWYQNYWYNYKTLRLELWNNNHENCFSILNEYNDYILKYF